jgi:hypothetical protein
MPELLVAGGVITILVVLAVGFIHPANYGPEQRNGQRLAGTAELAQAFNRYTEQHGSLPNGITDKAKVLGSEDGMLDLCTSLVPTYLKDMPLDPLGGSMNEKACDPSDASYISGYSVEFEGGKLVIGAPAAEAGENIAITRMYAPTVISGPDD